ncbi:hypothetical protein T484DRAFT_3088142 [Baffinella frigidus]|nr:hypothetical protein T484DRAFT_3088142 [Cryptophyta sp. CCMP2293]
MPLPAVRTNPPRKCTPPSFCSLLATPNAPRSSPRCCHPRSTTWQDTRCTLPRHPRRTPPCTGSPSRCRSLTPTPRDQGTRSVSRSHSACPPYTACKALPPLPGTPLRRCTPPDSSSHAASSSALRMPRSHSLPGTNGPVSKDRTVPRSDPRTPPRTHSP